MGVPYHHDTRSCQTQIHILARPLFGTSRWLAGAMIEYAVLAGARAAGCHAARGPTSATGAVFMLDGRRERCGRYVVVARHRASGLDRLRHAPERLGHVDARPI